MAFATHEQRLVLAHSSGWPCLSVRWGTRRNRGARSLELNRAVTMTEDQLGARTLGHLVRRGPSVRPRGARVDPVVSDWFDTRVGRTIQSVAASKWFGRMEPRELYEIAPSLGLSPEKRDRIEKAARARVCW